MSILMNDIAFVGGNIYTTAQTQDAIYVGGDFTSYIKVSDFNAVNGVSINATNADWIKNLDFNERVECSLIHGNSIYFGGFFTKCQGIDCGGLVKINLATGLVDTTFDTSNGFKNPNFNGVVKSLAINSSGTELYVGGSFTKYKDVNCAYLAKLNATNGSRITNFDTTTGFNSSVESILLDHSQQKLYVGGGFGAYKFLTANFIVKLNTSDASRDTSFSTASAFNSTVYDMKLDPTGTQLYVVGGFTEYKGNPAKYLAKIDLSTGLLNSDFDVSTGSSSILTGIALNASGTEVYIGGYPLQYKGVPVKYLAKLNATNASLITQFSNNVNLNGQVRKILVDSTNNHVYAVGSFQQYQTQNSRGIVKLDATNATRIGPFLNTIGFNQDVDIYTLSLNPANNQLYAGGSFNFYKANTISAKGLLKISKSTNLVDNVFDMSNGFTGSVNKILIDSSGNNIYVGGTFTNYRSEYNPYFIKLNATNGQKINGFNPGGMNGGVSSMAFDPSEEYLYIGGAFTTYLTSSAVRLAKIRTSDASLVTQFNTTTGLNGGATCILLDSTNGIYVGGFFTSYKGTARVGLVKLNRDTADIISSFDQGLGFNSHVMSLALNSTKTELYVGGYFTFYNNNPAQYVIKLNSSNGSAINQFNVSSGANSPVTDIVLDEVANSLYVSGFFNVFKSTSAQGLVKINATNADIVTNFNTSSAAVNSIRTISLDSSNNTLYLGGDMIRYKGVNILKFVAVDKDTAAIKYKPLVANVVVVGSVVVGVIEVNPITTAILVNDQPLPVNSVVKSTTGQKFIKVEGGATAFVAIEVIPPTEWGWSQEGLDAWAVLQNL